MSEAKRYRLNPALLAALDHFAGRTYDWNKPTLFVHTDPTGYQSAWPVERCCALAHEVLADEELYYVKFKTLQAGLRQFGAELLYERIVGEKLL